MNLLTHVYAVRNLLSKGASSDDASFSLRLIAHFLRVARGFLIEQKANKYNFISEQSYQSLCLDLTKGQFHNCCDGPTSKCVLLKSTTKIPKFLITRWGDLAKVMTLDGKTIAKTSLTASRLSKYSLTNKDPKPGWFIHDGYLYLVHNTNLEKILVNSLFEDPSYVSEVNCATGQNNCPGYLEEEFPIDPDLVPALYNLTLNYLTNSLNMPPKDMTNNAKDDQSI